MMYEIGHHGHPVHGGGHQLYGGVQEVVQSPELIQARQNSEAMWADVNVKRGNCAAGHGNTPASGSFPHPDAHRQDSTNFAWKEVRQPDGYLGNLQAGSPTQVSGCLLLGELILVLLLLQRPPLTQTALKWVQAEVGRLW